MRAPWLRPPLDGVVDDDVDADPELTYWSTTSHVRDLGSLAPGKLADMLLLNVNPLEDITHTRQVRVVLQSGEIVAGAV